MLLEVLSFLDLRAIRTLAPMNSKLHSLLGHEYFWRTRTASTFGAPPLDLQPASWLAFFKLRHSLLQRLCYKGRWSSGPGRLEFAFDFLITLFVSPNEAKGEGRYRKVVGAIRWQLVRVPAGPQGNFIRHRVRI